MLAIVLMAQPSWGEDLPGDRMGVNAGEGPFAAGTLAWDLSTNAAGYANGHSPGDMPELSGWRWSGFSGTNLAILTHSVWSTRFWLKGVNGLPATSIGLSNGLAGQGLMTMVSPRHYLFATHMGPDHYMAAFLDTNNVIYWRRTLQRVNLGGDVSIGILDQDLPSSVGFLPVLPTNYPNYLPTDGTMIQGIGMNQDLRLFGQPMAFGTVGIGWSSSAVVPFGLAKSWNVRLRGGDSSDPEMLLIGRQLVLVSHNSSVGGGPNYAFDFNLINQKMHYLSTNNDVGSDYQLSPFCLTNWAVIH